MFRTVIQPRVSETDGAGHINNTTVPVWFEAGRQEIFRMFMPDLSFERWKLVVVNINIDYLRQIYYGSDVEVRTWVRKIETAVSSSTRNCIKTAMCAPRERQPTSTTILRPKGRSRFPRRCGNGWRSICWRRKRRSRNYSSQSVRGWNRQVSGEAPASLPKECGIRLPAWNRDRSSPGFFIFVRESLLVE